MAMSKLHELLAVYGNITGQATKLRTELTNTFEKKRHHFAKTIKTFKPNDESAGAAKIEEQQDIQTSVCGELEWIAKTLGKAVDVNYQIDVANREAKGDVITEDGEILLKDVPTTSLLWLEKRVAEWKEMLSAIPTLDPAKGFTQAADQGKGIYVAREVTKIRTKKGKKLYLKYAATKEHPAQTELIDEDIPVGTITEQEWSSLITPAVKADLLDRAEILLRAVSKARAKANEHAVDVASLKIGNTLLDFVLKPLNT